MQIGAELRVHRAQADGIGAVIGSMPGQVRHGQRIAQPAVASTAQAVKLGGQAPDTRFTAQFLYR